MTLRIRGVDTASGQEKIATTGETVTVGSMLVTPGLLGSSVTPISTAIITTLRATTLQDNSGVGISLITINAAAAGDVVLTGGNSSTGSTKGGSILMDGGTGGASGGGGSIELNGGTGTGAGANFGGLINIIGGTGGTTFGTGGAITIRGGTGGTTFGNGAAVTVRGGSAGGDSSALPGNLSLQGANGNFGSDGGEISIFGGFSSGDASSAAGGVTIGGGNPNVATNKVGAVITIQGGRATGNALGGSVSFETSTAGSSGTTTQTLTTRFTIDPTKSTFTNTKLLATSHDTLSTALPVPVVLAVSSTVDATSTGDTTLYTVPAAERALITGAIVRLITIATFTSVPDVSINNGTDDIFASATLTGVDTAEETWGFSPAGRAVSIAAGASVDLSIDVAAVAGTYDVIIYLYGHLI